MSTKVFKVSSALKSILGKELITDDFIAVFELVKNSFDAGASRVDISFDGLDTDAPVLTLRDDGRGMTQDDLDNKWLFVAYSSKRDPSADYRDDIQKRRIFAGAKGIGRFSCDRLGSRLDISTKLKDEPNVHALHINWEDFELDSSKELEEIPIEYTESRLNPEVLEHGTIIRISSLREDWNREKLIKLKRSLEKLINPSQDNDSANFQIFLNVPSEVANDRKAPADEPWRVVNGLINNFVFENIGLKSISISVDIAEDGKLLVTRLEDRGVLIYEIKERNPLSYDQKQLKNVSIKLFNLNQNAKSFFTKYMGVRPSVFGSVLLYKNGFRIHPFGEYGDDTLGIDTRKNQGFARFLGTRDLIGRIEINDNVDFQEASSRDGGLIRNNAYLCLKDMFISYALKRLERYAIEVVKFGNFSDDFQDQYEAQTDVAPKIISLIEDITQSKDLVDIKYDPNVVVILNELSEKSLQNILTNFERIATENNNSELAQEASKAKKRLDQLNKARAEAEAEAERERELRLAAEAKAEKEGTRATEAETRALEEGGRREQAERASEQRTTQNIFLQSVVSQDISNVISLHHHIGIAASTIENYVKNMTKRIRSGKPFTEEQVLQALEKINEQARKIATTVKFSTKANFNLEATSITTDLCEYLEEYLMNVCNGVIRTKDDKANIAFHWLNPNNAVFEKKIRPMEISIIVDNLVNNARKAGAKSITASVQKCENEVLEVLFSDDGAGIPKSRADKIFDLGFTTTDGSGLGLVHVRNLMSDMNASIEFAQDVGPGAHFLLRFNK